jgi:hypothetical protein
MYPRTNVNSQLEDNSKTYMKGSGITSTKQDEKGSIIRIWLDSHTQPEGGGRYEGMAPPKRLRKELEITSSSASLVQLGGRSERWV